MATMLKTEVFLACLTYDKIFTNVFLINIMKLKVQIWRSKVQTLTVLLRKGFNLEIDHQLFFNLPCLLPCLIFKHNWQLTSDPTPIHYHQI